MTNARLIQDKELSVASINIKNKISIRFPARYAWIITLCQVSKNRQSLKISGRQIVQTTA
jgi:hypothetical protein